MYQNIIQSNSGFRCGGSIDSEDWFRLGRPKLEFDPAKENLRYIQVIV